MDYMKAMYDRMDDVETFIPTHIRDGIKMWIEKAVPSGSFVMSVASNDLSGAIGRADHVNKQYLPTIVSWFYNYAPTGCWGSQEKVDQWKGLTNVTVPR